MWIKSTLSVYKLYSKCSPLARTLFNTAPDIDEPPFQFICTMDLSVVDKMLHDWPNLVIHRIEIWAVWRHRLGARKFGVSWRSSSTVARARCASALSCWNTKSLTDILHIAGSNMTSLWRPYVASKKSARDITRISRFVTTMKLPHALQIYSTVFVKKLHFSR